MSYHTHVMNHLVYMLDELRKFMVMWNLGDQGRMHCVHVSMRIGTIVMSRILDHIMQERVC
jgi:hypothetical protein